MKYIVGTNRSQIKLFPVSLDQSIEHDNEVRLIDLFVNILQNPWFNFEVIFKHALKSLKCLKFDLNLDTEAVFRQTDVTCNSK